MTVFFNRFNLFAFTNPSALLALLGLLVPLAIHLWNRRPGREVAVGSLRWLAAGANRRLRNLRLEQLWLLLLRAALLAVLAVAIAGPTWRQVLPPGRGQVLVTERAREVLPLPLTTVRQTQEGSVMLGDSQEEVGFDLRQKPAQNAQQPQRSASAQ